ncbi:MAG: hypothetical protein LBB98_10270 [Treponema sp.]|nr:hypothetical protein [Treponema sp.]
MICCVFFLFVILPVVLSAQAGILTEGLSARIRWQVIAGTDAGLYGISRYGVVSPLWTGGRVRKIIRAGDFWAILSDTGVLVSRDLIQWENRNSWLPEKTIKVYDEGKKSFITVVQELKDLEVNPANPDIMVCATKEAVFLTRDQGRSWKSLGFPSYRTSGIKAVAVANLPELTVFLSHSTYGVHYIKVGVPGAKWTELSEGLERLETTGNSDEVSDIAVILIPSGNDPPKNEIYAAQTFRRRLYRLDWERKRFTRIWSDAADFGTVDSLDVGRDALRFVREGAVMELSLPVQTGGEIKTDARPRQDLSDLVRRLKSQGITALCLMVPEDGFRPDIEPVNLSELWLLDVPGPEYEEGRPENPAANREGLYLPVNHAMESQSLNPYLDIMESRNLNMVVIDMKDDYGRIRFSPLNPVIAEKGRVFRPVDIDAFLKTMKERGIYTAARVVVFKDPELARKEGGKFAVWDSRNNKPWKGYYDSRRLKTPENRESSGSSLTTETFPADDPAYEIVRTYYDEQWVDPYAEEVWDYIAAVGRELHERGFDEIQFDYIRFPTDGDNLATAKYRWQENGMDMESAMLSFLRHIRSRISAPISIDIYGANGWYRTGARTGQEVELLAPYVDAICPMYYPSHFEQGFLAQKPAELRPYRIYYLGTQRTARIARGQVIVRPYVQAFYLNVSYDRLYYNNDYVLREIEGVRNAGNGGLTYWNNSGRYADIPLPRPNEGGGGLKVVNSETGGSALPGDS